jgi:hypothetical protein
MDLRDIIYAHNFDEITAWVRDRENRGYSLVKVKGIVSTSDAIAERRVIAIKCIETGEIKKIMRGRWR